MENDNLNMSLLTTRIKKMQRSNPLEVLVQPDMSDPRAMAEASAKCFLARNVMPVMKDIWKIDDDQSATFVELIMGLIMVVYSLGVADGQNLKTTHHDNS